MLPAVRRVVAASALGTLFEWYDFYLYVSLASVISTQFFSALEPGAAFIFVLLGAAAGFIVRPFGALMFGRLGDMVGRKYTFLVTILVMGLSTFAVGLLPGYRAIGVAAPVILIALRLLQGLALGGEYGGAAVYVAEYAPPDRRGAYTAWIQTTATLGLFLSLLLVQGLRELLGDAAFADWGWRLTYLLSVVLLFISVWMRLRLNESPAYLALKARGGLSRAPVAELFGQWKTLRVVVLALLGLTAGQAVVWYTGHFYALFFLTQQLKVDGATASWLMAVALLIGAPFFLAFGALSDRIGRKPIIMLGCLLAALTYLPAFKLLTEAANPDLARAQASAAVTVTADPRSCSFQVNPVASDIDFRSSCDIAKRYLAQNSVSYDNRAGAPGTQAVVQIGSAQVQAPAAELVNRRLDESSLRTIAAFKQAVGAQLQAAGYPVRADPAHMNKPLIVAILAWLVLLVTMVYGPIAAMLAELFPTRIRYTATGLPYHVGNGWFGGLLPTTAFAIVASTGNIYSGLWYPIVIAAMTLVIGTLFVRETRHVDMLAD